MTTTTEAKALWSRLNALPRFGPIVAFLDPDAPPDKELLADLEREVKNVVRDVTFDDGDKLAYAPSPWHAGIFLYTELEHFLLAKDPATAKPQPVRCYYRGQSDSSLPIVATIDREGVDQQHERNVMDLFVLLLDHILPWEHTRDRKFSLVHPGRLALEALGRHHGIASKLLDFSADPAVAIYFASRSARTHDAVVFAIPSVVAWKYAALTVLLPPPFSRRIYEQRGVFLLPPDDCDLRAISWEIRFPPNPDFQAIRDNMPVDLNQADEWLEGLVSCARQAAEHGVDKESLLSSLQNTPSFRLLGDLDTQLWAEGHALEWASSVWEALEWFLWYVAETPQGPSPMTSNF